MVEGEFTQQLYSEISALLRGKLLPVNDAGKICVRCGKPVTVNADHYELFEKMHWLCFHLEWEHHADPDEACSDTACPWWHIEVYRKGIVALGHDPDKIVARAIEDLFKSD